MDFSAWVLPWTLDGYFNPEKATGAVLEEKGP